MDTFNAAMRALTETYVGLFGDSHPLISLGLVSVVTGIAMLWVFGKTSNQALIERTKKKLQAHLLELRLYGDDPGLLFRAQWDLLRSNVRYIGLMMKPAIFLALPTIVLLLHLDAVYGKRPLQVGESAIVTVQAANTLSGVTQPPEITSEGGLRIDTPPVRADQLDQYSWRITAESPGEARMYIHWLDEDSSKEVAIVEGGRYVPDLKVTGWVNAFFFPWEKSLTGDTIEWIEVLHPAAQIETGGFTLHWLVWFLVLSIVAGYLLKDRFGVTL